MSNTAPEAEAELEAFRQRWREEVSSRNKKPEDARRSTNVGPREQKPRSIAQPSLAAGPSTARRKDVTDYADEVEPKGYHDLPDKEEQLKLGAEGQDHDREVNKQPSSALEHYEHAVEKETTGQLGDSITHYRRAFKVCFLIPHSSW